MARPAKRKPSVRTAPRKKAGMRADAHTHILAPGFICDTDARGFATPGGRSPVEIVVDASEGFIPLWARDTILRWRFRERSLAGLDDAEATMSEVRTLLAEALLAWGDAAPVRFTEDVDLWDFEIVVRQSDNCSAVGCVLASAFFPDPGRHQLVVYPKLFEQKHGEQVDTLVHETGHIFGLRHFFANVSETDRPSEIFGRHSSFSIMNYGELSQLTDADREDLQELYTKAWTGELTAINRTPIRLVRPYHALHPSAQRPAVGAAG